MRWTFAGAWVGALPMVAACSGDVSGGGASCGAAKACGGDVTGSWSVEAYCTEVPPDVSLMPPDYPPECRSMFDQAVAGAQVTPIDMRMDFDGATYSTSGTASMRMTLGFTQSCILALAGTPLTAEVCGQLSSNYRSDPDYRGSCSYAGSICRCTVTTTLTSTGTGPYVTSDTELRVDGEPVGGPYCVEGDQLTADFVGRQGTVRIVARR